VTHAVYLVLHALVEHVAFQCPVGRLIRGIRGAAQRLTEGKGISRHYHLGISPRHFQLAESPRVITGRM
jgi:hypothetical protein